eukprot:TRINITY_DN72768_c0_g1_i1.p1 TRINITY_DN72768_c0_g1~~TRINITY_DN72768_c0_g1_i1.p1  ORF type:complete len:545 (+),score=105.26 TRINITY_DN72768_c0_g1_i1:74-1636(+)
MAPQPVADSAPSSETGKEQEEHAEKRARTDTEEQPAAAASTGAAGQEAAQTKRVSAHVTYGFEELCEEIDEFRRNLPAYVTQVGELRRPTLVCEDGKLIEPPANEPWDLPVWIKGGDCDAAYEGPWRVRIRFDFDLWPKLIPLVRFQGVFHHALIDDSQGMSMGFYKSIPKDERGLCTLRATVKQIHEFLKDPYIGLPMSMDNLPAKVKSLVDVHAEMNEDRNDTIRKYAKMVRHPCLFKTPIQMQESWFAPSFWKAHTTNTPEAWRAILTEHLAGNVFSFDLFTSSFCEMLLEETFNFYDSGLEARRPNSMNNYGIIYNEIGLEPFVNEIQSMLQPLGQLLWPGPGSEWDGHHCFIVRYREGEDLGLDMHTDDSDVTFNICLGLNFDGAGLQFCGGMGQPDHRKHSITYKHVKARCVCHLGRRRHGADDITSGERLNLILWNHSSTYRDSDDYRSVDYFKEEGPPDSVCVSYTHDRDYGHFKKYPTGKEDFKGRGWCPRPKFEYEGFTPDCDKESAMGG